MGKVLLNQFRAKLAKKIQQHQGLSKPSITIDANDVASKRNQLFISCLSKYLSDERIQKSLVKINPYTVKFGSLVIGNNYGMSSTLYITLSLITLDKDCLLYTSDAADE